MEVLRYACDAIEHHPPKEKVLFRFEDIVVQQLPSCSFQKLIKQADNDLTLLIGILHVQTILLLINVEGSR